MAGNREGFYILKVWGKIGNVQIRGGLRSVFNEWQRSEAQKHKQTDGSKESQH